MTCPTGLYAWFCPPRRPLVPSVRPAIWPTRRPNGRTGHGRATAASTYPWPYGGPTLAASDNLRRRHRWPPRPYARAAVPSGRRSAAWAAGTDGASAANTSMTPTRPAEYPPSAGLCSFTSGMVKQMPMEAYRGYERLPQPRLLAKPDPLRGGPEFVGLSIEDYLLSGNALAARSRCAVPTVGRCAVQWLPAQWVWIAWTHTDTLPTYYYLNKEIPFEDVIHVRRSADR